jgi:m7GpppX diphosphatase
MIEESYSMYEKVVKPVILSTPKETTTWVDNILAGVSEADKVIYNDQSPETGFILLPDMKWDQSNLSTLYLQVLVRPTIHSMRDLNDTHLPLLNNIKHWVPKVVLEKYGVDPSQIRMFFHYQPTYYRLHVHVTHIQFNSLKGMTVGQAHLLDTVIDNIANIDKGYYQKCTLHYALGDNHPIYRAIQEQKE